MQQATLNAVRVKVCEDKLEEELRVISISTAYW